MADNTNTEMKSTTTKKEFPSLTEIKRSIPKECFESDAATSLYFTARALLIASTLAVSLFSLRSLDIVPEGSIQDIVLCAGYIFLQGVVFWGFFTIGHDCGHSSFSRYHELNFVVGCIMHSLILTPFESWRISHRHHHKNTGNIDKDEIFYPHRQSNEVKGARAAVYGLGAAWFLYLQTGFAPRKIQHLNPWEKLFNRRVGAVTVSLLCWGLALATSILMCFQYGFATMALYYYAPILVFGSFLVVVTFLHHNDEATPWYADSEWNYVKGNLSSVDRSYGWLINNLSHNIGTHQIHHLFPIIPHYKLNEATTFFRAAFPEFVRQSDEPILSTFLKTVDLYIHYGVVADDEKIFSLAEAAKGAKKTE